MAAGSGTAAHYHRRSCRRSRGRSRCCSRAPSSPWAGGGGGDENSNAPPTPENTGGEQQSGCAKAQQPEPKSTHLRRPRRPLSPSRTYVATVKTNCGEFQITLDARNAPRTGGSFKYLADSGFYDGTTFHRIVPGFVIQGG